MKSPAELDDFEAGAASMLEALRRAVHARQADLAARCSGLERTAAGVMLAALGNAGHLVLSALLNEVEMEFNKQMRTRFLAKRGGR